MAGGFGYTVTAPMEIPYEPPRSPYGIPNPGLKALPDIDDSDVTGLRLQGTLAKALPGMPVVDAGGTIRQEEAAELAIGMRNAFAETRFYNTRSQAIAKAKNRQAQKIAEDSSEARGKSAYNRSVYGARRDKYAAYRGAEALTGPSAGPYMTHIRQNQGKDVP